jgi:hypothetical protein
VIDINNNKIEMSESDFSESRHEYNALADKLKIV